jgi:hypothetical protein
MGERAAEDSSDGSREMSAMRETRLLERSDGVAGRDEQSKKHRVLSYGDMTAQHSQHKTAQGSPQQAFTSCCTGVVRLQSGQNSKRAERYVKS